MSGEHSTKNRPNPPELINPPVVRIREMPDPDNLRIDLSNLPKTGAVSVPLRG